MISTVAFLLQLVLFSKEAKSRLTKSRSNAETINMCKPAVQSTVLQFSFTFYNPKFANWV